MWKKEGAAPSKPFDFAPHLEPYAERIERIKNEEKNRRIARASRLQARHDKRKQEEEKTGG